VLVFWHLPPQHTIPRSQHTALEPLAQHTLPESQHKEQVPAEQHTVPGLQHTGQQVVLVAQQLMPEAQQVPLQQDLPEGQQ
jgi:hypothetical protein